MNFPGKKEPTANDSKTTLSWQEGLHVQQASPCPKEPLPTGVESSSTSQLQLCKMFTDPAGSSFSSVCCICPCRFLLQCPFVSCELLCSHKFREHPRTAHQEQPNKDEIFPLELCNDCRREAP